MWLSLLDIIFCVTIFFCRTSSSCLQTAAATWAHSGKAELASLRTRCQGKNKILQQFSKYLPVWAVTSDKVLGGSKQWNSDPERFVDVRSQVLHLFSWKYVSGYWLIAQHIVARQCIGRKYFPLNLWAVFHLSQTASYGFDQNRAKFGPLLFVILDIRNAMVRPIVDWLNQGNVNLFFLRTKLKRLIE